MVKIREYDSKDTCEVLHSCEKRLYIRKIATDEVDAGMIPKATLGGRITVDTHYCDMIE